MLYRKRRYLPIPDDATISTSRGKPVAVWTDRRGGGERRRTSPIVERDGERKMVATDGAWRMRVTVAGEIIDKSTGMTSRDTAEAWLTRWRRQQELIAVGLAEPDSEPRGPTRRVRLESFVGEYLAHMEREGRAKEYVARVRKLLDACWPDPLKFVQGIQSPSEHNNSKTRLMGFGAWLVREGHVKINPYVGIPNRNTAVASAGQRRALSADELAKLIDAARTRKHRMMRADEADLLGRRNVCMYLLMALSGLRHGEIRQLRVDDFALDGPAPFVRVRAGTEKARRGASLPVRSDVVRELAEYLDMWRDANTGQAGPFAVASTTFGRQFRDDLSFAGIPNTGDGNTIVTPHCLRHTYATLLARSGASMAVAQQAMRHSDPALTMDVYTHIDEADVRAAAERIAFELPQKTSTTTDTIAAKSAKSAKDKRTMQSVKR